MRKWSRKPIHWIRNVLKLRPELLIFSFLSDRRNLDHCAIFQSQPITYQIRKALIKLFLLSTFEFHLFSLEDKAIEKKTSSSNFSGARSSHSFCVEMWQYLKMTASTFSKLEHKTYHFLDGVFSDTAPPNTRNYAQNMQILCIDF